MLPRAAKVYLTVVAAVLAAGLVVLVTAAATGTDLAVLAAGTPQPGNSSTKAQANCDRFIGHVASNLGKNPDQVKKAMTDALNQSLDDAVKAGELTQQQADAIKARESGKPVCSSVLPGVGPRGQGPGRGARVGLGEY